MSGLLDGGRHDWLGYLQPVGLVVTGAVLGRLGLWPEPQAVADSRVAADAVAALAEGDAWPLFRDVLGWPAARVAGAPGGPGLPERFTVSLLDGETLLEPSWAVRTADGDLLVRIEAPGTLLDRRGALGGWEATPHQRFERLLRETGAFAGVLVGAQASGRPTDPVEPVLRLVVAPKGEGSGHASWPLPALGEVSGRSMLAGLRLLLDDHALFTGAPSRRLAAMLAESRAAQAAVSTRLAPQVLAALHELLRGFDAAAPDLVRDLAARRPQHLYEGLLTVLLRLIFILYAEDRELMPSRREGGGAALYEQGYALGGLHVRLLDDAALNPDVMDERRGGWGRLLALFGLVERGDPSGFMQARGGRLFDGTRFPFLLGQVEAGDPARVLPVSDGCVLRVLDALLTLDGERVAYRALSVEQIGSVYETVMGFTVEAAPAPMLAIRAGKANRVPVWIDLAALARTSGADRGKLLKEGTGRGTFPAAVTRALRSARDIAGLAAALAPVVDARACPSGAPVDPGTPILQPTDERRRTGSHYTPVSLTRPIVAHALEPAFARIGAEATPDEVLDLKVCDPAVGSGAFLVEACRQLADRLVAAWDRWPADRARMRQQLEASEGQLHVEDDDLTLARRLVARRCLYGVDKNPLALDLARLGLWLLTLARNRRFVFFEHSLRAGDSLVGLPNAKIKAVTWGEIGAQRTFVERYVDDGLRAAWELRAVLRSAADELSQAQAELVDRDARTKLRRAHLTADAVLEAFFSATTKKARDARIHELEELVGGGGPGAWARLETLQAWLNASPIGITAFHWELEFPEVFQQASPGFDAIVGNPPFAGKNTIASGHPLAYPDWLKTLHPGAHGNADLAAHFFRRAFGLLRQGGAFGLIATNTIRQGDTRESGLARIIAEGGTIYRAVRRHRWEGDAAVVVSQVFVRRGASIAGAGEGAVLDGRPVRRISAYLVEGDMDGSPAALRENAGKAFAGYEIYGMGFTFDDVNAARGNATPLSEMQRLFAMDQRNREIVRPYLGGEEVNTSPTHAHHRYAVDFADWPLRRETNGPSWNTLTDAERKQQLRTGLVAHDYPFAVAADWPDLLMIVERLVKPERDLLGDDGVDLRRKQFWWQYGVSAKNLASALAQLGASQCIVTNRGATPHVAFAMVPASICLAKTLAVFTLSTHAAFATLQSRVHELWARFFASSMKDDLRYTPSDCFETFPLPPGYADAPALEAAGRAYHDHRAALMIARQQGMTPTYNRFHRVDDNADDIAELRRLHHAMDRAVLAAYGWDDLAARAAPAFLDEDGEDDHKYQNRLFWPAPFRDELLARLLRLNEERAQAERRL